MITISEGVVLLRLRDDDRMRDEDRFAREAVGEINSSCRFIFLGVEGGESSSGTDAGVVDLRRSDLCVRREDDVDTSDLRREGISDLRRGDGPSVGRLELW